MAASYEAVRNLPPSPNTRLVVDVGGTKLRLVECDLEGKEGKLEKYMHPGERFASLDEGIAEFLLDLGRRPTLGVVGAAGPIEEGKRVKLTNVPTWPAFDIEDTERNLGIRLSLFNDLVVAAASVDVLGPEDLATVRKGHAEPHGPRLVVTLSTGLNDALVLPPRAGSLRYIAGESGHIPFAARTNEEIDLLQWAWKERNLELVSFEHVMSGGHGFGLLFDYVTQALSIDPLPSTIERLQKGKGKAPAISDAAITDGDPACLKVLSLLGPIIGTFLGSRAAATLASGGVYLVGGVSNDVPLMTYLIEHTDLLERFANQGVMSTFVQDIPIWRITHPDAGLAGAAEIARHLV